MAALSRSQPGCCIGGYTSWLTSTPVPSCGSVVPKWPARPRKVSRAQSGSTREGFSHSFWKRKGVQRGGAGTWQSLEAGNSLSASVGASGVPKGSEAGALTPGDQLILLQMSPPPLFVWKPVDEQGTDITCWIR